MKVDFFKLNNLGYLEIDEDIDIPKDYYGTMDINDIKNVHIDGVIKIDYDNNIVGNFNISGTFILPDAYTLEDIPYDFDVEVDDTIGRYDDFYDKNKNILDILPFIWENIVSEVPIRVTKLDKSPELKGEGWELNSD